MIFNGREVTEKDVEMANYMAMIVAVFGFPEDVKTREDVEQWYLDQCEGDEWLANFCGFVTVVTREMMETGCTQLEAMAKHVTAQEEA